MPDIFQDFPIRTTLERAFAGVSTPTGLDAWWTKRSSGKPFVGQEFELWFGPEYDWRGVVTKCTHHQAFELKMTRSDTDWEGTRVGFEFEQRGDLVWVRFYHTGWPTANEHYRISNHCWAMYLRILRRYLEAGETVPYEKRLDV
jgi:hypothetical protein